MRLDKYIASNSAFTRSDVKKLLKSGAVLLNGEAARRADEKVSVFVDQVSVQGQAIEMRRAQYYMLNKPVNVVCANTHSEYPTVLDLLTDVAAHDKSQLQIAGRLDVDTTGLVLLTDDGQWNHKVTSPRSDCFKFYDVELESPLEPHFVAEIEEGILLPGESKPTLPAKIELIDPQHLRLGICEGRYHQVKRMFLYANNKVHKLHRHSIASVKLDPALAPGEYRALTDNEIKTLASAS